jgi:hypothetical protein
MLITLNQQDLENTGDECAPCTKAAGSKGTKGRAQLQTGDTWQVGGVYGRLGAREELNRRADTSTYVKDRKPWMSLENLSRHSDIHTCAPTQDGGEGGDCSVGDELCLDI